MNIERYKEELAQVVNIDCGTSNTDGVTKVAGIVRSWWEKAGWNAELVSFGPEVGAGVFVCNKPDASAYDVLLIGHLDTVYPSGTVSKRPMSDDGQKIYGPGVSDMKGGILNILWAMRALEKHHYDRLSIAVAMNPDEETGSVHSTEWICELAKKSKYVLVCEAARADGSLVKSRKGTAGYQIIFTGIAAHAGNEPEKGRSAVTALANCILAVNKLANLPGGTTVNVGVVRGGSAPNVIADNAVAEIDVRFWQNEEFERIDRALHSLCDAGFLEGVSCRLVPQHHKPAMVVNKATEELMHRVEAAGNLEGINITWKDVGGGSDANATSALGIPSLDGLGPVGAGFHSSEEWLDIASVEPRIRLLTRIVSML